MKPGAEWGPWKRYVAGGLVAVAVLAAATPLGPAASLFAVGGLGFVWRGVRSIRQWRAVQGLDRKQVGSLHGGDGMVAVEGTVGAADDAVTAPFSQEEAVAYRVQIARQSRNQGDADA